MSGDEQKFDKEEFLSRWSRLKQQAREQPPAGPQAALPAVDPKAPPPELPSIDKLTIDSDFRGFFHPKVDEKLRRAALKKLFSDPRFNVMDGLDVYIDDYSKSEPIPPEMLQRLVQAQNIFANAKKDEPEPAKSQPAEPDKPGAGAALPAAAHPDAAAPAAAAAVKVNPAEPAAKS